MNKTEPTLKERAMFLLAPKAGEKAYQDRVRREKEQAAQAGPQMRATGYGSHGASRSLNSMIGWLAGGGSAQEDIDEHGALLRARSRDLYAGGGMARGGINVLRTNVVGIGVQPKPKIDGAMLAMSDEECSEWERNTLREFRLFAENHMCDAERQKNFYALQKLAFLSMLMSGDVFAVFGMQENKRTPYRTTIRLLEADRISTPGSMGGDSEVKTMTGGGMIVDGVEIDSHGTVVRYHIASRHPLAESAYSALEWVAVDALGKDTDYPNILHITTFERPEQRRGIPFVAAQIEQIKQLDRYITSELAANVVASMLAAFIVTQEDDGKFGIEDAVNDDEKVTDDPLKIELAPGAVFELPPGKTIKEFNPIRSNTAFEGFISTLETIIGTGMEIPKEVLIKKYESNYTAARSALLDFWKTVKMYRADFIDSFNRPVYEQWLAEAVSAGRIQAPGFFDDPAIRQAWCGCMWMGASMGHVDPLKEVKAAQQRIQNNISTQEQEASEYNGNDWNENVRQRKKELQVLENIDAGKPKPEQTKKAVKTMPKQQPQMLPARNEPEVIALQSSLTMSEDNETAEIMVYGVIVTSTAFQKLIGYESDDISASDFDKALKTAKKNGAKKLWIRINSPGGVVRQAVAMRKMLMETTFDEVLIDDDGLCASAASLLLCVKNAHVRMAEGSELMIHQPRNGAWGTVIEIERTLNSLRITEESMCELYASHTGKSKQQILDWMKEEKWFTAQQAVDAGFAHEVYKGEQEAVACVSPEMMQFMKATYSHIPDTVAEAAAEPTEPAASVAEADPVSPEAPAASAGVLAEDTQNSEEETKLWPLRTRPK